MPHERLTSRLRQLRDEYTARFEQLKRDWAEADRLHMTPEQVRQGRALEQDRERQAGCMDVQYE